MSETEGERLRRENDEYPDDADVIRSLRADLAAATSRAELAEHAAAIWEQRCSQATALSGQHVGEVAAARQRAERAEQQNEEYEARVLSHTTRLQQHVEQLQRDLAAAREGRDRLREALQELLDSIDAGRKAAEHARIIPTPGPLAGVVRCDVRIGKAHDAARAALETK